MEQIKGLYINRVWWESTCYLDDAYLAQAWNMWQNSRDRSLSVRPGMRHKEGDIILHPRIVWSAPQDRTSRVLLYILRIRNYLYARSRQWAPEQRGLVAPIRDATVS